MKNNNWRNGLTTIIFILLYFLYYVDAALSDVGMYLFDSYNIHEAISLIPYIGLVFCISILIYNLVYLFKHRVEIRKCYFTLFLLLTIYGQIHLLIYLNSTVCVVTPAKIEKVDSIEMQATLNDGRKEIVVECPYILIGILEEGEEYLVTYEKVDNLSKGKLIMIQK